MWGEPAAGSLRSGRQHPHRLTGAPATTAPRMASAAGPAAREPAASGRAAPQWHGRARPAACAPPDSLRGERGTPWAAAGSGGCGGSCASRPALGLRMHIPCNQCPAATGCARRVTRPRACKNQLVRTWLLLEKLHGRLDCNDHISSEATKQRSSQTPARGVSAWRDDRVMPVEHLQTRHCSRTL